MGYETLSLNFWIKTFPALIANTGLILLLILRKSSCSRYLIFFSVTLITDALVASNVLSVMDRSSQVVCEVFFVWLHDFRFFYLVAALLYAGKGIDGVRKFSFDGSILKPAFLLSIMPTLLLLAANFAKPDFFKELRHQFLTYEVACLFIVILLRIKVPAKETNSLAKSERNFLKNSFTPVLGYYVLWVISDILIMQKIEYGYLLRIVPNFLYYAVFLWWIYFAETKVDLTFERK